MNRLIRFLAVIAIALSPVWGLSGQTEAHNASYPVWPSFLSTGCQIISGPTGSTTISCGVGDFLLTQVNSGYACNQLDISVSNFFSGPFTATATVNSGSQSNSVSIDSSGNYYMQFPGFLVNNLITIQIAAPDSGTMTISSIQTSTCPVPTSTPTVNPSSTATNTPVPVTGTPTPIPTFTPLPSGHSTFTSTSTPVPATGTATSTATATPGPSKRNCGDITFPLLNCDFLPGGFPPPNSEWIQRNPGGGVFAMCADARPTRNMFVNYTSNSTACTQSVVAANNGTLWVKYQWTVVQDSSDTRYFSLNGNAQSVNQSGACATGSSNYCYLTWSGITNGTTYTFGPGMNDGGGLQAQDLIWLENTWVQPSSSPTPATPVPGTSTPTLTPVPGTSTPTLTPTLTPIPIPGAMSTNIPTATECPGGCVVTQLTAIPGMATRVTVDTSPFSPFTSLSLARSTCAPFGYVAIPYPVVHGTPAYGSTTPLSVTWTIPITAPWDDTHPFSNTAIQPCAMLNEIPSTVWDFTYWFSVFAIAVVFIMWLIGFVGRLSGEETING